jgi:hypothetical protein
MCRDLLVAPLHLQIEVERDRDWISSKGRNAEKFSNETQFARDAGF